MEIPNHDIESGLKRKGFQQKEGDHHRFEYPGTIITTKTSHGKGKSADDYLLKKMAVQVHLQSKEKFMLLINCPMSADEYREHLITIGRLAPPPALPPPSPAPEPVPSPGRVGKKRRSHRKRR